MPPFDFSFSFSSSSSPPKFVPGAEEYHTLSYGTVLGPPFHLPIFPSLPLRRLSLLLATLLAPSHASSPSFVSLLLFFWPSRSLGFSFLLFFCCVVCLPVRNSLWGRGRFALTVKYAAAFSPEMPHVGAAGWNRTYTYLHKSSSIHLSYCPKGPAPSLADTPLKK